MKINEKGLCKFRYAINPLRFDYVNKDRGGFRQKHVPSKVHTCVGSMRSYWTVVLHQTKSSTSWYLYKWPMFEPPAHGFQVIT